jgi:serpin B
MRDAPSSPAVDPKILKPAADGLVAFAADLYAQLRADSGNLLASPYSIRTALAMVATGARDGTFNELQIALHLPSHGTLGYVFRRFTASVAAVPRWVASRPELAIANSIWAQQDHSWKPDFLAQVRDDFQGELFGVDYREAARDIADRMNRWIAERTRGRIRNLISPGSLNPDTRIVLTNAIYFKARWDKVFHNKDTKPEDFILPTGTRVKSPLMYQRHRFGLLETETFQVLRLPYAGHTTSMYVLLPRKSDGLPHLERQLTGANLAQWTTITDTTDVKVWLPKFRFTVPRELNPLLKALGVNDVFDVGKANLKGATEHPEGLFLSRVIHEACIEVDEIGTEAAAATVAGGRGGYAGPRTPPPPPKEFRADHPFLFVIKHNETGAILFLGRVEDPTK